MIIIGTLQQAAKERLNANHLEILPADFASPDRAGGAIGFESKIFDSPCGHRRKNCARIANVAHLGIGKNGIGLVGTGQRHDLVGMRHFNGPQHQRVEHSKDNDIGGNSEPENKDRSEGEAGRAVHLPHGKSQVL